MGGCCFTPRKTQLLWWYWLLLFSVVGIPMFAAALYVQRAARHGIIEPWQVRAASHIFWLGTFLVFLLVGLVTLTVGAGWLQSERFGNMALFAGSFVFWLAVAVAAAKVTEKTHRRHARLAVATFCALTPATLTWLPYALLGSSVQSGIGLLPLGVMKFVVCMLPAHFWYRFTTAPDRRRAWLFLATLAVGTFFFWLVSRYGYNLHVGVRQVLAGIGFYRL